MHSYVEVGLVSVCIFFSFLFLIGYLYIYSYDVVVHEAVFHLSIFLLGGVKSLLIIWNIMELAVGNIHMNYWVVFGKMLLHLFIDL